MKPLFIILIFLGIADHLAAQTFNEWFRQKQTQKKYLIQQIAALQVYSGYVQKGYNIAKNGLGAIGNIKKGDLSIHTDYFSSLKSISPAVAGYARMADIIRLQLEIVSIHKTTTRKIRQSSQFTADELKYMEQVYKSLLDKSAAVIDELIRVTTAGKLEMKDDERLRKIDEFFSQMQELQEFAQPFFSQAQTLAIQRQKEQHNIQSSRLIYGIK